MNQKIINLSMLALLLGLSLGFSFFNFSVSKAQTTEKTEPTPTVSPTPKPAPTIENDEDDLIIETELVNLNVRVVDRNNRPVAKLQQSDFQILEDKVPQAIEFFSQSEVPTNYALVIDNSGSLRFQLEKVIEASKIIVNTNKPEDETGVVRFVSSDKIEILQDFTTDKSELFDALDNMYIEGGQTAIIDAIYLAAERVDEYERSKNTNDRKRRALILVSDGEDRNSFYKEEQLFELLRESDVQIYAIGFVNDLDKEGSFIRKSPQKKAKNFLTRLATETGGKSYFPNALSELNGIARDIASELRTQYSIGYIPTNDRKDGKFRNIKVVVKDGPKNEKRIAITKTGRIAEKDPDAPPTLQKKDND
jgi:Ca-activated chloride channel family protein